MRGPAKRTRAIGPNYHWHVLSVTSLGVLLTSMNSTALMVGLPVVSRHFGATASQAYWVLLSYMLVNTGLLLTFGRIADLVGRKRLYLLGMAVVGVGGLLCVAAPNVTVLIGLRAAQGVGAAAIVANTSALITDAFPRAQLGLGLGLNVTVAAAGQILGPLVGGGLATWLGWWGVLGFTAPIAACGVVWAFFTLQEVHTPPESERFDLIGALLAFLALSALVWGLSSAASGGWGSPAVFGGLALAGVGLAALLYTQLHGKSPLLDLSLLRERERSFAYASGFCMAVARNAVVLLCALYLQSVHDETAFTAGLQVTLMAVGMMATAPLAGRLARDVSSRVLSTSGSVVASIGLLLMTWVVKEVEVGAPLVAALLLVGVGVGMFNTPNTRSIMIGVSAGRRGVANGLRSTLQNTGFLVSTAMAMAILTSSLPVDDAALVYSGDVTGMSPAGMLGLVPGYHAAFLALLGFCIVAGLLSLLRGPTAEPEPVIT